MKHDDMIKSLKKGISQVTPHDGLESKIKEKKGLPLVVKLGFDPTAPDLHLGHAIVLKKVKDFQLLGHKIIIIIGGFTARIGDPTGKNKMRPSLSEKDVIENSKTYMKQTFKILDSENISISDNNNWLSKLTAQDIINYMSKTTVAQMIQRDDFSNRLSKNIPIGLHEFIYPIMQGIDSVHISADVEIGGTDQLFNCLVGRQLQEKDHQVVISMPLLIGTDGKEKMSKSKNNHIGLTEAPNDMFGKIMSISDDLIIHYLNLVTNFDENKIQNMEDKLHSGAIHPMEMKKIIAFNAVEQYHSFSCAQEAQKYFESNIQNKSEKIFTEIPVEPLIKSKGNQSIIDICQMIKPDLSKSQIRRLISQGSIKLNDTVVSDFNKIVDLSDEVEIKIGKRGYFKVI